MTGKKIGYIRVSTEEQNPERQLENIFVDKKFIDFATSQTLDRPQLKLMLEFVREDDIVIVHSMDRLGRKLIDLKNLIDLLVSKKVEVHFIKEGLQFKGDDSPISNLILYVMGACAEFEYSFIRERQREGISIAKKAGKYKGRKKLSTDKILCLQEKLKTREPKSKIAKDLGISRFTLYKYIGNL